MCRSAVRKQHGLGLIEIATAAAFHHVGCECPGAAGKTDQRHIAVQFFPDQSYCIHDISQFQLRIGYAYVGNILSIADRFLELRAFAFFEVQSQAHGVRDGQDI